MCAPFNESELIEWLNVQCLVLDIWVEALTADPAGDTELASRVERHRNWLADELLRLCETRGEPVPVQTAAMAAAR